MKYKVIIVAIPGIGTKDAGFSRQFERDIRRYSHETNLQEAYLIKEIRPFSITGVDLNQKELFKRLDKRNNLGGILSLRKFALEAFGDAVTFESGADRPNSVYKQIQTYLRNQFKEVSLLQELHPGCKLVIVAASMGVHVLSNYIWDADYNRGVFADINASHGERLKNLNYLFSIGCNIPLFLSGLAHEKIKPFAPRNATFKWDNYYDKDDILGWPLADLSEEYSKVVTDHEIDTGQYIGSHMRYWKDDDFTKPFVHKLCTLIQ